MNLQRWIEWFDLFLHSIIFEGFPTFIADVDECTMGTDDCISNAMCMNTVGGFYCECKPGYYGSGSVCTGNYRPTVLCATIELYIRTRGRTDDAACDGTARGKVRLSVRALKMKYTLELYAARSCFVNLQNGRTRTRCAMLFCQLRKRPHACKPGRTYRPVRPLVLTYNSMCATHLLMSNLSAILT